MNKRKSTHVTQNMTQTALWLPHNMHKRLREAGGERGMGEEIRERLQASFNAEDAENKPSGVPWETEELLREVSFCAEQVSNHFGSWFKDAFAFQVLKASVETLLNQYRPEGDPSHAKPSLTQSGERIFGKNGEGKNRSPEEFGRTLAQFCALNRIPF